MFLLFLLYFFFFFCRLLAIINTGTSISANTTGQALVKPYIQIIEIERIPVIQEIMTSIPNVLLYQPAILEHNFFHFFFFKENNNQRFVPSLQAKVKTLPLTYACVCYWTSCLLFVSAARWKSIPAVTSCLSFSLKLFCALERYVCMLYPQPLMAAA